jgi:hypothetical protein
MSHRFSQNGKPLTQHHPDADTGEYVKNEVDLKLDRINDLWMKLERKLLKEQPPRRIACLYHRDENMGEDADITESRYLGIQRHSGKWRVCYAIVWDCVAADKFPWKPIVECDVETRADAVKGIGQLKRDVRETRKLFIPALDKAISTLEHALDNDEED